MNEDNTINADESQRSLEKAKAEAAARESKLAEIDKLGESPLVKFSRVWS